MPPIGCTRNRVIVLGSAAFLIIFLLLSAQHQGRGPIKAIKDVAQSAASSAQQHVCPTQNDETPSSIPPVVATIAGLFGEAKQPITSSQYFDAYGARFDTPGEPMWTEPLGREVLIVDMDTRFPERMLGGHKINWENMTGTEGDGMLSASFLNHFLYAQIHGYDYKFYHAQPMEDHHNTWIKPFVLDRFLHDYRFVVFIDADATVQHLEVPLEWLLNRWNFTPNTSIAMPIDTKQILGDDRNASCDSRGVVTLNTGFIITQNLPHTFRMMDAWKTCTSGKRYKDCGTWKENWSHEQRAFSEYIRYDFNPDGNNIVDIPCDDAMGYPGLAANHPHIISDCRGQFVRHHTIDKDMTKTDTGNSMAQLLAEIMQKTLVQNKDKYLVNEEKKTKGILGVFQSKKE